MTPPSREEQFLSFLERELAEAKKEEFKKKDMKKNFIQTEKKRYVRVLNKKGKAVLVNGKER